MVKRLVDIEDETLKAAQRVLGTTTIEDTINTALRGSIHAAEHRQQLDHVVLERFAAASKDLLDADVMADAWR
jgi:Arc/MetJ family transcription regulator